MRSRLGLLGSNPAYGALWGARTVSLFGSFLTITALVLYLEEVGASATQVGIALAARTLPQALGPVAGTFADRIDRRKLMIACDLGGAACVGAIAVFLPPFPILVALIAASGVFSTLFLPAGKSAVPALVSQEQLTAANALLGSSLNLGLAAGPAVGALLVAGPGARAAFALDALTFVISTALLLSLPALRSEAGSSGASPGSPSNRARLTRFVSEIRAGLGYVAGDRVARAVAVGLFLGVVFAGMDNVGMVFLVRDSLDAGQFAVGLAASVFGVAMTLTPLLLLRSSGLGRTPSRLLLVGMGFTGIGLILTGLAPVLVLALAAYALAGAGNGLENVACDTLLGRTVPASKLGRVFGTVYAPIFLAESLAVVGGGLLLDLTSPRTLFLVAGAGMLAVLLLVWKIMPRSPNESRA